MKLSIHHEPVLEVASIEAHYSKKEGVPIFYVGTTALENEEIPVDIFYRGSPHPIFGNRYFGIFIHPITHQPMITNADRVETMSFASIVNGHGKHFYSRHVHDYKVVGDQMIDGGRVYTRSNAPTVVLKVKDGEWVLSV